MHQKNDGTKKVQIAKLKSNRYAAIKPLKINSSN